MAARGARATDCKAAVGVLGPGTPSTFGQWVTTFVRRLHELGWIEGRTVTIEYRRAEGRTERAADIAAEFVLRRVDVIVTSGTGTVLAAKQATSVIPIVFAAAGDPVGTGIIAGLARPGGNITGLSGQTSDAAGKRLELLREVVAGLRRLAIIGNVGNPLTVLEIGEVQAAARTLGLEVISLEVRRRRHCARLRGAQWLRRGTLCRSRPAHEYPPHSHQYLGTRGTAADDARLSGVRRSGRLDVLRNQFLRPVAARR